MVQLPKLQIKQAVLETDLPDLASNYQEDYDGLLECERKIQEAFKRIQLNPLQEGKQCRFDPLKGFRSMKVFSSSGLQRTTHSKPDLRIIYDYDSGNNSVTIICIGFRRKELPRPADDPYSKAASRYHDLS